MVETEKEETAVVAQGTQYGTVRQLGSEVFCQWLEVNCPS